MIRKFMKNYRFIISTLSPVHIACGEDFVPVNYTVKNKILYNFSMQALVDVFAGTQGRAAIDTASDSRALQKLYGIQSDLQYMADRFIPMTQSAAEHHSNWLRGGGNFAIERTSYSLLKDAPILPGSSLKGAVRTAILNTIQKECKETKAGAIERDLLGGSFDTDPFRHFKLGDANVVKNYGNASCIMTRHSRHRKDGTGTTLKDHQYTLVECLMPFMPRCLQASFTEMDEWSFDYLKKCNQYYFDVFLKQIGMLDDMKCSWWADQIKHLVTDAVSRNTGFLLRVGKHCGADTISMNKFMKLKTKYKTEIPISTTLCCLEHGELVPFGWIFVEVAEGCDELSRLPLIEGLQKLLQEMELSGSAVHNQDFERRRNEVRNRLALARVNEQKKQAEQARLEAQKAAEAARISAMTPNQQKIEKFRVAIDRFAGRLQVGGELWGMAHELIKAVEGGGWSQAEKQELLSVCERELPPKLKEDSKKQKKLTDRLRAVMS
ncbi:MAG: hypothetical protein HQM00_10845 [Magnetococcales bacterium]|nr:hypothetical protein [Magnetococcales bacterium]